MGDHVIAAPMPSGRQWVYPRDGGPALGWVLGKPLATSSRGAVKVWHWHAFSTGARGTEERRKDALAAVVAAAEDSSQN